MNSVSNLTYTPVVSPLSISPAPELPALCHVINHVWETTTHDPMLASGMRCSQNACFIPPTDPEVVLIRSQNETGCSLAVVSTKVGVAEIEASKQGTETATVIHFDEHEIRQVIDFTNRQLHIQWKNNLQSEVVGEFKLSADPLTKKIEVLFKYGEEGLSGECVVGEKNILSCTTAKSVMHKWLYGCMTADIEEQMDASGAKVYTLSILKHPPLPFSSPEEIGYAHYSFDEKNNKVTFLGAVKAMDGSPLLDADISYEADEKGNPVTGHWSLNSPKFKYAGSAQPNKVDVSYMVGGEFPASVEFSAENDAEQKEYSAICNVSARGTMSEERVMLNLSATLLESVQKARVELLTTSDSLISPDLTTSYHAQGDFSHQEDAKGDLYQAEMTDSKGYEFATKFRKPKT